MLCNSHEHKLDSSESGQTLRGFRNLMLPKFLDILAHHGNKAESIPGPQCGRKDYVNEKSQ